MPRQPLKKKPVAKKSSTQSTPVREIEVMTKVRIRVGDDITVIEKAAKDIAFMLTSEGVVIDRFEKIGTEECVIIEIALALTDINADDILN